MNNTANNTAATILMMTDCSCDICQDVTYAPKIDGGMCLQCTDHGCEVGEPACWDKHEEDCDRCGYRSDQPDQGLCSECTKALNWQPPAA